MDEEEVEGAVDREGPHPHAEGASLGRGYLARVLGYGRKVWGLADLLGRVRDGRSRPQVPMETVMRAVFFCGLLRVRSFNALEPQLGEPELCRALGFAQVPRRRAQRRLASVDTLSRALRRAEPDSFLDMLSELVRRAERQKVFREGWIGARRYAALDGWEPISSRYRHCEKCSERVLTDGKRQVVEYFHRYVVCLLLGQREELVLGFESIENAAHRPVQASDLDEGEQTAAIRLLHKLRARYGRWLEVIVADGLYANGPFLTALQELGFSGIVVAKKETDEPLRDALAVWGSQPGTVVDDAEAQERLELWDCPGVQALMTYDGAIRVVRAVISPLGELAPSRRFERRQWCALVVGKHALPLSARQVLRVVRGRWHLENTGFNQWTQYWKFEHVFITDAAGIAALFATFFLAFNLLQLFVYRQLKTYGRLRGKDPTRTILRVVDIFWADLHRLLEPLCWDSS
jgi:DDE family transposase